MFFMKKKNKYETQIFTKSNGHFFSLRMKKAGNGFFWSTITLRSYKSNKSLHFKGMVHTGGKKAQDSVILSQAK